MNMIIFKRKKKLSWTSIIYYLYTRIRIIELEYTVKIILYINHINNNERSVGTIGILKRYYRNTKKVL